MSTHPGLRTALLIGALLIAGLLAACGGQAAPTPVAQAPTQVPATQPPPPTNTEAPTNTAVPPTNTVAPPTATTAPTLTAVPTTAPATPTQALVAAAPADADNCVKCHTSQETLQKLAVAPEPTEKLSEGEG